MHDLWWSIFLLSERMRPNDSFSQLRIYILLKRCHCARSSRKASMAGRRLTPRLKRRPRTSNQFPFRERKPFQRASHRLRTVRSMSSRRGGGTVESSASNRAHPRARFSSNRAHQARVDLGSLRGRGIEHTVGLFERLECIGGTCRGQRVPEARWKAFDLRQEWKTQRLVAWNSRILQ